MAKLVFVVRGMVGTVSLDSFLAVLDDSFVILKDLDSAISSEPGGSLDWMITGLRVGSLDVEIESKARDPERDYGGRVVESYVNGIDIIHREGITPPYFSDVDLKAVRKIARTLGKNGEHALEVIDPASSRSVVFEPRVEKTAKDLMGHKYRSLGSVEGTLEMISIHRKPRFNVYHAISLRAVGCSLPDELRGAVVGALGRRVVASGLVSYNAKHEPVSVVLEDLEVIPKEDELPGIEEFIGSDPRFTGDMTTGEYIRGMRSG